jgi:hypothetical protein
MTTISLRADCANCSALCCMALAFDRSSLFAIDKPAGEPCPNLDACGQCRVHDQRAELGFGGCIAFDCQGAGQRATNLFRAQGGWMKNPALIGPISRVFSDLLRVHDYLSLLEQVEAFDLSPGERDTLAELRMVLERDDASHAEVKAAQGQIDTFLKSLRSHVEAKR